LFCCIRGINGSDNLQGPVVLGNGSPGKGDGIDIHLVTHAIQRNQPACIHVGVRLVDKTGIGPYGAFAVRTRRCGIGRLFVTDGHIESENTRPVHGNTFLIGHQAERNEKLAGPCGILHFVSPYPSGGGRSGCAVDLCLHRYRSKLVMPLIATFVFRRTAKTILKDVVYVKIDLHLVIFPMVGGSGRVCRIPFVILHRNKNIKTVCIPQHLPGGFTRCTNCGRSWSRGGIADKRLVNVVLIGHIISSIPDTVNHRLSFSLHDNTFRLLCIGSSHDYSQNQ